MDNKYITREDALNKTRRLCSKQEKCISELSKKLKDWHTNPEDIDGIIDRMIVEGFINENRFVKAFINDKIKLNKWGKRKVTYHLRLRGISESVIKTHLDDYNENDYFEMIKTELLKKSKTIILLNKNKLKLKLYRFSESKGYERNIVFRIFDDFFTFE